MSSRAPNTDDINMLIKLMMFNNETDDGTNNDSNESTFGHSLYLQIHPIVGGVSAIQSNFDYTEDRILYKETRFAKISIADKSIIIKNILPRYSHNKTNGNK